MKKLLALLLVLLTLVPFAAACQSSEAPSETTAAPDTDPAATEDPFDDKVPDNDYNEWNFVFAAPTPNSWGAMSYDRKEDSGETIESAIYQRNREIEDRFNINISAIDFGSTGTQANEFQSYAVANEDKIDIIATGFYQSGKPLIVNDYILPWNDVEYINLDKEWWNKSVSQTLSILDNFYYIVGDVNWFTMSEVPVCYFNKVVAEEQEEIVGNLYEIVKNNQWTFETCLNIAKQITNDSTGDGKYDANDTYGAINNTIIGVTGFLYSANVETVKMTDAGPEYFFNSKKMQSVMTWIVSFCCENNTSYTFTANDPSPEVINMFFDNRALFYFDILMHAQGFRDKESDFGIIPYPKYDTAQANYVTYANQWGLACALPITATNTSRTGAILEALCAKSRKYVVPAYYEKTLMGKIKRDDESEEMLDIIFQNILYDFGICYCTDLSLIPAKTLVENNMGGKKTQVTSWYRGNQNKIKSTYLGLFEHVYDKENGVGACKKAFPDLYK